MLARVVSKIDVEEDFVIVEDGLEDFFTVRDVLIFLVDEWTVCVEVTSCVSNMEVEALADDTGPYVIDFTVDDNGICVALACAKGGLWVVTWRMVVAEIEVGEDSLVIGVE